MKGIGVQVWFALLLMGVVLNAAKPLEIYVQSTSGSGQTFQIGGTNIDGLITQVVERQGQLAVLVGQPFDAQLSYLGVPNSARLNISANGLSATLEIPSANFKKTFTAATPNQLNNQIQNFLRKEGSSELAEMRRYVNTVSPAGITDGNPYSTTALLASEFFDALALDPNRTFGDEPRQPGEVRLSLISGGGAYNASTFHGWRLSARVQADYRVNRKLSLVAILPFNYLNLEGSQIYGVGGGLGVPIAILGNFEERKTRLTVAPFVGGMFRWSEDLAGGGAMVSAGANASLTVPLGEHWEPSLIVQISDYRGVPFDVDGYQLDKVVDQQVLKVGGQVVYRITDSLLAEGYAVANRFLQDAAVQNWVTVGAGLKLRLWRQWFIGGGYELDSGADFNANAGRLTLGVRF